MDPNFDRIRRRLDRIPGNSRFDAFRRQFRRSSNGRLLGVFSGIAESKGWSVCRVRWIGVAVLLFVATSAVEVHTLKATLIVCGFFYLLAALLMQSPNSSPAAGNLGNPPPMPVPPAPGYGGGYAGGAVPPPYPGPAPTGGGMRPDFAQIDRQLDGLSRRIQRMETIVTDRQYDWERRMGS